MSAIILQVTLVINNVISFISWSRGADNYTDRLNNCPLETLQSADIMNAVLHSTMDTNGETEN